MFRPSFHYLTRVFLIWIAFILPVSANEPVKIVAFGDSLVAGFGLDKGDGFVPQLQAVIEFSGLDAEIVNAGVSGDTTSGGRSRLDWSVGEDTDAVILELGANDMLRGLQPALVRENLDFMLNRLVNERGLPVLLAGMQAAPNLGEEYAAEFNAIYPELAEKYGVLLYPFFLDGVAGDTSLNQPDGIHPTVEGVQIIVGRMLPMVEELIGKAAE